MEIQGQKPVSAPPPTNIFCNFFALKRSGLHKLWTHPSVRSSISYCGKIGIEEWVDFTHSQSHWPSFRCILSFLNRSVRWWVSSSGTSFWTLLTVKSAMSNFGQSRFNCQQCLVGHARLLDTADLTVGSVQELFLMCETRPRTEQLRQRSFR